MIRWRSYLIEVIFGKFEVQLNSKIVNVLYVEIFLKKLHVVRTYFVELIYKCIP